MAARYWVGGNDNWDATAGTKWSLTSGGAGGEAVPTSTDDVFLDNGAGTGNVTIAATSTCQSLTCTGYVGILAGTSQLTVALDFTLSAAMTYSYTGSIFMGKAGVASNWNTFGKTITEINHLVSTGKLTLLSNITVITFIGINSGVSYLDGTFNIEVTGTLNSQNGQIIGVGSTTLSITGNATWTGASTASGFYQALAITVNCTTLTITNYISLATNASLIFVAGTIDSSAAILQLRGGTGMVLDLQDNTFATFICLLASTVTILSGFIITGNFTISQSLTSTGAYNVYAGGNLTTTQNVIAEFTLTLNGTGVWTSGSVFGCYCDLVINTAGIITVSGSVRCSNNKSITYTAGTVITTGSTIYFVGNTTINTDGISWNNIGFITTSTKTFTSTITVLGDVLFVNGTHTLAGVGFFTSAGGNFSVNNNASTIINLCNDITFGGGYIGMSGVASINNTINNNTITLGGGWYQLGFGATLGTTSFIMNGSGTIFSRGSLRNPFEINTTGSYTFIATSTIYSTLQFYYGLGSSLFKYTTGTVLFEVIMSFGTTTVEINNTIDFNGGIDVGLATLFTGTEGWTTTNFSCKTAGATHSFTSNNTYYIATSFNSTVASNTSRVSFVSSSPGTKAIFTLSNGGLQNVGYTNATDIDSNAGQTIFSFNGVITDTFNWNQLMRPQQYGHTFQH